MQANGLRYGLGGYWDGSETALEWPTRCRSARSTGATLDGNRLSPYAWETNTGWFDPAKHYANFVILDLPQLNLRPTVLGVFGKPVRTHIIANWEILVYNKNLLTYLAPPAMPPTS